MKRLFSLALALITLVPFIIYALWPEAEDLG